MFIFGRFYECVNIQTFQKSLDGSCMAVPYWFMVMESVTKLTSNVYSSLCCLLFGLLSADVKREVVNVVRKIGCCVDAATGADADVDAAADGSNEMDQASYDLTISTIEIVGRCHKC